MSEIISRVKSMLQEKNLYFSKKPILIGGMAMEYYGVRKTGVDIDLIICDEDYQSLARQYPDKRKDIFGDLGVILEPFEMWRCIMLCDYDFYAKDAVEEDVVYVASLDRLLLMRVFAMDFPKHMDDLKLLKDYYFRNFLNEEYLETQVKHLKSYEQSGGIIWGGKYIGE